MDDLDKQIERLVTGELSDSEANILMEKISTDEQLKKKYAAYRTSHAAFEFEISNETRKVLSEMIKEDKEQANQKPKIRVLYIAGIAATFLVLILSVLSVNITHNDTSIADNYNINSIAARNGDGFQDTNFSEAVQAYFRNDFAGARKLIELPSEEDGIVNDYKDWLMLMINLKDKGSNSSEFLDGLRMILNDNNHEFNPQAKDLEKDLNTFWRLFVVKK